MSWEDAFLKWENNALRESSLLKFGGLDGEGPVFSPQTGQELSGELVFPKAPAQLCKGVTSE